MRFKEVLKKYGVSQNELAERLGINRVSVNRMLRDENDMRYSTMVKFASAIGCKVTELVEETNTSSDFAAFIRYEGKHYHADSLEELKNIIAYMEPNRTI